MTHEQKNALVLVTCQYTEAVVTAAVATGTFSPVVVLYCSRSNASFLLFANYLDPQEAKKDNWETCERIFFSFLLLENLSFLSYLRRSRMFAKRPKMSYVTLHAKIRLLE